MTGRHSKNDQSFGIMSVLSYDRKKRNPYKNYVYLITMLFEFCSNHPQINKDGFIAIN